MRICLVLAHVIVLCHAKFLNLSPGGFGEPSNRLSNEDRTVPHTKTTKAYDFKFVPTYRSDRTSNIVRGYREKRGLADARPHESSLIWAHSERLDENGDFVVRWSTSGSSIVFRVEGRTRGYLGLGFNTVESMKGADLVMAWVDDRTGTAHILDCHGGTHGLGGASPDETRNYELVSGFQNETHTTVEFRRALDTCDPDDFVIGDDTTQVLWSLGPEGSDGELSLHSVKGSKPLRLLLPVQKPESIPLQHWDLKLKNITVPKNIATFFWCKIFKSPDFSKKHHIVGYQPIIDSLSLSPIPGSKTSSPVHHMVVYECAEDPYADKQSWNDWADGEASYGPDMPREWASCLTPVAAWAKGSKGEFLPENVGIPFGEKGGVSYYMLEIHYDNEALHNVIDNSGIRIHYTSAIRRHDAALLGSGVTVSALHVIPPRQKSYKTVGICSSHCTDNMIPNSGINIVSVLLHAHGAAKKISLKHIRGNRELAPISEENRYDARYQQSRLAAGRKLYRGDTLLTECTYDTTARDAPTLGGYSTGQEMCLSFILYYPRTELAGCYSMTPIKEFFETFGVRKFYKVDMTQVENLFLSSGSVDTVPELAKFDIEAASVDEDVRQEDQAVTLLRDLMIEEPAEFHDKSFMAHLNELPWGEAEFTKRVEDRLFRGTHMAVCKKRDDSLAIPIEIQHFPNYTELVSNETGDQSCSYKTVGGPSATTSMAGSAETRSLSTLCLVFVLFFVVR